MNFNKIIILFMFFMISFSASAKIPNNFGTVLPGIFRGGIITQESEYVYLASLGVNTIISLEFFHKENEYFCNKFKLDCQRYGILQIPYEKIDLNQLKKAFKATLIEVDKGNKIYIHCYEGSDRTGALSSALVIRNKTCDKIYDNKTLEKEIISELNKYKFNKWLYPSMYDEIVGWTKNIPVWICE